MVIHRPKFFWRPFFIFHGWDGLQWFMGPVDKYGNCIQWLYYNRTRKPKLRIRGVYGD